MIDFGSNCSWCGHAWPHPPQCEGTIVTTTKRTANQADRKACPCVRAA